VKNLFKNVPARRGYLKADATEYNHVLDTFTQFALAHPQVGFSLIHNDKVIYQLPATDDLRERIEQLFKKQIADIMMPAEFTEDHMTVRGFIGKPHQFSKSRSYQYLFINNRYVKSPAVHKAILNGYGSLLPHGTQPVYVLHLQVDPRVVDVNVHPRKLEVRFSNSQQVFRFVVRAINQVLRTIDMNKQIDAPAAPPFEGSEFTARPASPSFAAPSFSSSSPASRPAQTNSQSGFSLAQPSMRTKSTDNFMPSQSLTPTPRSSFEQPHTATSYDIGDWTLLGQVKNSYLLVENADRGLLIIDQHGAAERVNYHNLLKEYESGKSAIKFGDRLTLEEQMKLLHDTRYKINNEMACAHGRPIILELGWDYIDRRFERT
jgi:DNA mismatch repair protein MutL